MNTITIWALCGFSGGASRPPAESVEDFIDAAESVAFALSREELPFGGWGSQGLACEIAVCLDVPSDDFRVAQLIEAQVQQFSASIPDGPDAAGASPAAHGGGFDPDEWANPFLPDCVMSWFLSQHAEMKAGTLAANVDAVIEQALVTNDEAGDYASYLARQFLFVAAIRAGRSAADLNDIHDSLWFAVMTAVLAAAEHLEDLDERGARVNELLSSLAELFLTREGLEPGRGIEFSAHEDLGLRLIIEKYGISQGQ